MAQDDPLSGWVVTKKKGPKLVASYTFSGETEPHYQVEGKTLDELRKEITILWGRITRIRKSVGVD